MVKLHEYQSKDILRAFDIPTPQGGTAATPEEARTIAKRLDAPVVIKAQVWTTNRAAQGLVRFAAGPDEAYTAAADLLGQQFGSFTVEQVLVEVQVHIEHEWYLGLIVDDRARAPVLLLSLSGGSGIEERATDTPGDLIRYEVDIRNGLQDFQGREIARQAGLNGKLLTRLGALIKRFYNAARHYEARSAEINPLVVTPEGQLIALDARFTIDDYAVFRHPELDIDVAREFDHPPTQLERVAWQVEKDDYRGTFYFIQLAQAAPDGAEGSNLIGFHGTGGGGSMINMDALLTRGFQVANFVDTSGNPPASKVYRAARIILSQPGIRGYFLGGSGVASQEQFHSARGLVKAFMDVQLNIPAVIRIGGNGEARAIEILHRANGNFPAPVEAYGRDDSPDTCADRLRMLIDDYMPTSPQPQRKIPAAAEPYQFNTVTGGTITLDYALCRDCNSKACIAHCAPQILALQEDVPVLNISRQAAESGGCTECLACEIECYFLGNQGGYIHLPIHLPTPGLESEADNNGNPD